MHNFPMICRFCLIPCEVNQTISIFDGSNELKEKIFELTNIQILNEDGLPQEVCFLCLEQLDQSVTFKRQVIKADCMLQEFLTQQVDSSSCPGPLITGDVSSVEQKLSKSSDDSIQEEIKDNPDLINENDKEELNASGSLEDNQDKGSNDVVNSELDEEFKCNNTISESSYLDDIVKQEIDEDYAVAMSWPEVIQSEGLEGHETISEENDKFDEGNIKTERDENNIDGFGIKQVKKEEKEELELFQERKSLKNADLNQPKAKLNYCDKVKCKCEFCRENGQEIICDSEDSGDEDLLNSFENQGLRRSSRPSKVPERHVVPHYSCSKCERMYNDQATLENHEKTHLIIFKCNHCGKKFSNKDHLTKHIQSSHIGKTLKNQCEICGKSYEKRPHLFSHMRSHKSTVQLCEVCGKTVSVSAYAAHKRTHSEINPHEIFQCDLCDKKFNNKMSLRTHKSSYHGTLKFTCEVCGKQFTRMALMKHHQNSHSGRRDHVCQVCSRAFTLKVTLKSHMRIHTGETPYSCGKCGQSFTWKTTYRNHIKSCKGDKSLAVFRPTNSKQHCSILQIPQSVTQESPIDYSEEAKYKVCSEYNDEARLRPIPDESRFLSSLINLSEGIKYPFQQSMYVRDEMTNCGKDFRPS